MYSLEFLENNKLYYYKLIENMLSTKGIGNEEFNNGDKII